MGKRSDRHNILKRFALVGDIGGTNCRLGIMSSAGEIVERAKDVSSRSLTPQELVERMEQLYIDSRMHFDSTYSFAGVSLAIAGLVNQKAGLLEASPHLEHWVGVPFIDMFREKFPGACYIENDATAATFAEFRLGAGIGAKNMVYIAIGTGVGGGLIIDGHLYRGSGGFAGEIGHIYGGSEILCACGNYGCLEAMNSGSGIEAQLLDGALADTYEDIESESAFRGSLQIGVAAKSGHIPALELIRDVGKGIGIGLGNVLNVLNPDTLIIGGGLSALGEEFINSITVSLQATAFCEMTRDLKVSGGSLGDYGGMLGAGLLLFDQQLDSKRTVSI